LLSHHRKGHGIHSPFVYDLVSRVFRRKVDPDIINKVERIRKKMLSDRRRIVVKDLGAGYKSKTDFVKVSTIARKSPVPKKYGKFLMKLAEEFGKPEILELGTSLGISTLYMASSCPDSVIYTIEGSKEIAVIARQNFNDSKLTNISVIDGSFDEILPDFINEGHKPGLIFIDGNHRKVPLKKYFNLLASISDNNSLIIIDDINYSKEMEEAWKEIKLHEKVTLSIDIYRMGILFFRKGINHNDYVIRY
jgi:predicted O-methyltransferase YrrM